MITATFGPEGTQKFAAAPDYPAETTYRYGLVARLTQIPLTWFRDQVTANVPIGRSLSQVIADGRVLDAVEYSFNMGELNLTYRTATELVRSRFSAPTIVKVPYRDRWLTGTSANAADSEFSKTLPLFQ